MVGCCKFDDTALWNSIEDLDNRVEQLEELCDRINTNITSLQAIIQALETQDYITNVVSLPNDEGYIISFISGKNITIYHGHDGKDGQNGKDGVDGEAGVDGKTPEISVKQHNDGIYYWTVNGEWLIVDGHKVKAVGTDGKDGADGEDGKDGVDGADGQDGITPQFKIENGYSETVNFTLIQYALTEAITVLGLYGEGKHAVMNIGTENNEFVLTVRDRMNRALKESDKYFARVFTEIMKLIGVGSSMKMSNDGFLELALSVPVKRAEYVLKEPSALSEDELWGYFDYCMEYFGTGKKIPG